LAGLLIEIDKQGKKLTGDANLAWFEALKKVQKDFYEFIVSQSPSVGTWGDDVKIEEFYKAAIEQLGKEAPST